MRGETCVRVSGEVGVWVWKLGAFPHTPKLTHPHTSQIRCDSVLAKPHLACTTEVAGESAAFPNFIV